MKTALEKRGEEEELDAAPGEAAEVEREAAEVESSGGVKQREQWGVQLALRLLFCARPGPGCRGCSNRQGDQVGQPCLFELSP